MKNGSLQDILRAERSMELGGLAAGSGRMLGSILPIDSDYKRFNIFFAARNGFFTEELRIRKRESGEWIYALRVSRDTSKGSKEILFEKVDPNYPKEKDGTMKWD